MLEKMAGIVAIAGIGIVLTIMIGQEYNTEVLNVAKMRYIKIRTNWLKVFLYTKASQPIRKERESNKVKAILTFSGKEEIKFKTSFINKF